jgi:hypothetical protein
MSFSKAEQSAVRNRAAASPTGTHSLGNATIDPTRVRPRDTQSTASASAASEIQVMAQEDRAEDSSDVDNAYVGGEGSVHIAPRSTGAHGTLLVPAPEREELPARAGSYTESIDAGVPALLASTRPTTPQHPPIITSQRTLLVEPPAVGVITLKVKRSKLKAYEPWDATVSHACEQFKGYIRTDRWCPTINPHPDSTSLSIEVLRESQCP